MVNLTITSAVQGHIIATLRKLNYLLLRMFLTEMINLLKCFLHCDPEIWKNGLDVEYQTVCYVGYIV